MVSRKRTQFGPRVWELDSALYQLSASQILVAKREPSDTGEMIFDLVDMIENGKTADRAVKIGSEVIVWKAKLTDPVVLRTGTLHELFDSRNLRPPRRTVRRTGIPVEVSAQDKTPPTVACTRCDGLGFTGSLITCDCLSVEITDLDNLPSDYRDLNPDNAEDRDQLATRADPLCELCDGRGVVGLRCYDCGGAGWHHTTAPFLFSGPNGVVSGTMSPNHLSEFVVEDEQGLAVDLPGFIRSVATDICDIGEHTTVHSAPSHLGAAWGVSLFNESFPKPTPLPKGTSPWDSLVYYTATRFGSAIAPTAAHWPPTGELVYTPPQTFALQFDILPEDPIGALVTTSTTRIGFGQGPVATGTSGPQLLSCDGVTPNSELACDYTLLGALAQALSTA